MPIVFTRMADPLGGDALDDMHTQLEDASIEDPAAPADRTALMAVSEDLIVLLARLENLRDVRA